MDQFCSACNYALELLKLVQCNHLSYHKKQAIRCLKLKNKLVQDDKHPTEGFGTFLVSSRLSSASCCGPDKSGNPLGLSFVKC